MGINSLTLKFRNDLLELINNANLPICNIEMVISNALTAVQAKLKEEIQKERESEQSE